MRYLVKLLIIEQAICHSPKHTLILPLMQNQNLTSTATLRLHTLLQVTHSFCHQNRKKNKGHNSSFHNFISETTLLWITADALLQNMKLRGHS